VFLSISKWMGLSGEDGKCVSNLGQVGADVGCGGTGIVMVGVASVCPGNGVAEVTFNPCKRGVAEPVGADLLDGNPRKVSAETYPEVVVSAGGYCPPILVAQQLATYRSVALVGVLLKVSPSR